MSLLTRETTAAVPHGVAAPTERTPLHSPVLVGALAAVQAVAAGLIFAVVPVMLVWMGAARVEARWSEAARVGADGWLVAHGAPVALPSGTFSVVPMGLTALVLGLSWVGGRRLSEALRAVADPVPVRDLVRAVAGFVGSYAALAALVGYLAGSQVARPLVGPAVVGAAVLALAGAGGATAVHWWPNTPGGRRAAVVLRSAGRTLLACGAVCLLLLIAAAYLGRERMAAVNEALDPGAVGQVGLILLQLAFLPDLAVWAGSWLAGPGFSVGAGTSVGPGGTVLGPLPAIPVLGALPEPGSGSGWVIWVLAVLLVVACGALGGCRLTVRRADASWRQLAVDLVGLSVAVGCAVLVLAWASSGSVGPGRMAVVGPSALAVAGAVSLEVLAGAVLGAALERTVGDVGARSRARGWTRSRPMSALSAARLGVAKGARSARAKIRGSANPSE